jgi:hypothetical protein
MKRSLMDAKDEIELVVGINATTITVISTTRRQRCTAYGKAKMDNGQNYATVATIVDSQSRREHIK